MSTLRKWYALYTKPNLETRVAHLLSEQEIETYLPQLEIRKGSAAPRLTPFFPCYLFAHMDLESTPASRWQWTPGLRAVVAFDGSPAVVPEPVIELLRTQLVELESTQRSNRSGFQPGDAVRVTHGPLVDLVGLFERETTSSERVCVLLNYLGRAFRVHLNAAELEKTAAPSTEERQRHRRTRGCGRRILPPPMPQA
jgi:transcription elongation factor/antiterminator RfaH